MVLSEYETTCCLRSLHSLLCDCDIFMSAQCTHSLSFGRKYCLIFFEIGGKGLIEYFVIAIFRDVTI